MQERIKRNLQRDTLPKWDCACALRAAISEHSPVPEGAGARSVGSRHRQELRGLRLGTKSMSRRLRCALHSRPVAVSRSGGREPTAVCVALLARLNRIDVLLVDDWAMALLSEPERRDFWEICEDRYQVRSTILTSQLPVSRWRGQIGDPTLADGIPRPPGAQCPSHRDAGRFNAQESRKVERPDFEGGF
jgi:hypothetical protein